MPKNIKVVFDEPGEPTTDRLLLDAASQGDFFYGSDGAFRATFPTAEEADAAFGRLEAFFKKKGIKGLISLK